MRDLVYGCKKWQSAGILTDGKTYGVPAGLIFSFPVISSEGKFKVVEGL
jgi:malate dehydrogenase